MGIRSVCHSFFGVSWGIHMGLMRVIYGTALLRVADFRNWALRFKVPGSTYLTRPPTASKTCELYSSSGLYRGLFGGVITGDTRSLDCNPPKK